MFLWNVVIKTRKTIVIIVGCLLLDLKLCTTGSQMTITERNINSSENHQNSFTSYLYGIYDTKLISLFYSHICNVYDVWIDTWLISIDQQRETPLDWQHVTSSQQGFSPVGTTMSYHAQENYKLQGTGNFPTLSCVLLLLLLELGNYCEWNWENENAKHCNHSYSKHKHFQNGSEWCVLNLKLILRIISWYL